MSKIKAALIHLSLSVLAITGLFLIIYYIWYPQPFFNLSNTIEPLKLLISIDVIIGPILTFVVYKKAKKLLVIDLSIIAVLQIAAFIYGAYTIYQGRPTLLVMNQGNFHYLVEKFSDYKNLTYELKPHLFSKPKYAYNSHAGILDQYSEFATLAPIGNVELELRPYSLTKENMIAKFSKKADDINTLVKKYQGQEVLFFLMDKDTAKYYVLYSVDQGRIIDRLEF